LNPSLFSDVEMDVLDEFVERSLKSNTILDSLAFHALSSYFTLRYKNLWWTCSAKESFGSLLECLLLNEANFILENSFIKCILTPFNIKLTIPLEIDDPKALDCSLFLKRLQQLQAKTFALFDNNEIDSCIAIEAQVDVKPSAFYVEALSNFLSKLTDSFNNSDDTQNLKKIDQRKCLNFLKILISLFDSNVSNINFNGFINELDSFKVSLINLVGPLIVEKVEITNLLSELIPLLQESEGEPAVFTDFDEDFRTKNSQFEVNLTLAQVFKDEKGKKMNFLTFISLNLLKVYSKHLKATPEQEQILNDWKLFMLELELEDESPISSQALANTLREAQPYFDFPHKLVNCTVFEIHNVLPNPALTAKKISTPEQWIPFIYLVLKSEKTSKDLILDWLFILCESVENCSGTLLKLIKENVRRALIHDLLKRWIESGKLINQFPFYLTDTRAHEFILRAPHLPAIISQNSSIETLLGADKVQQAVSENLSYLVAACLLEESFAKFSNRKSVDFSFCKIPAITSIKFVPLISILLLHGQFYPWPVLISALQSLAKMFKLSAATDFSEIFNPVHSVLILREIVPFVHDFEFLKNLFKNIPILSHHPQLLKLVFRLLESKKMLPFEIESYNNFKASTSFNNHCTTSNNTIIAHNTDTDASDLITFILTYGNSKLFSINEFSIGIFELVFKLLNLPHLNGNRIYPLESFQQLEKEDLKMLILPLGSKVLCFNEANANFDKLLEFSWSNCSSPSPSSPSPSPSPSSPSSPSSSAMKLLKSLVLFLISHNNRHKDRIDGVSSLISEIISRENDFLFLQSILPLLFDSFNENSSSFSIYPQIIQKLIEALEGGETEELEFKKEILKILLLIIEKTPIGPNVVDTLLRRFSFNPNIFKLLQNSSKTPLYFFFLFRESPKMAQTELDLKELGSLLNTEEDYEYYGIVKKRLSKFESYEPSWPIFGEAIRDQYTNLNNDFLWLDKKWFDQTDFKPKNLNLKNFNEQAGNFKNLHQLLFTGNPSNSPQSKIIKTIENCLKNKKSPNFKEILLLAEEPEQVNFNGISLLSLISPRMEQVAKHLLVDMTSKIYWKGGDVELALETAKGALSLFPAVLPDESKALLLSRIGEWAAASKLERPSHILSQYLEKAMTLCENTSNFSPASLAQIHIKVARFVDDQYQQIKESEDFKLRAKLLEESKAALSAARASSTANTQDRRQLEISISTLRSQYDLDMQEYSERLRSLNAFLLKSVQNYIAALSFGTRNLSESEQMAAISRLCALWFSNSEFSAINELINNSVTSGGKRSLPLQLFLPLIYQLAARASYDPSTANPNQFQRTLMRLLVQLTLNHPFDCIYQLLSLRSGSSDDPSSVSSKKRKLLDSQEIRNRSEADLRAAAACVIIDQTRKIPTLSSSISAVEVLVDAYIELANTAPPSQLQNLKSSTLIDFTPTLKINKLLYPLPIDSPLRKVPIPTGPSDGETFAGFFGGYRILGGINLPKQIEAISSNGTRHAQLVKGKDDVRQDAVMEQVFLRVNKLLAASHETRKRKLGIRTYRVIPLRPLVGLLEWVSDSIPLATFLSEAHERLRPGDLNPIKCRELLRTEAERPGSTIQSKLNVLLKEIGQRFRPVLRYFFFEHFSMNNWWTAKQAYTASMATASIVGWIVGLGDRHGMNILLDKRTGEIVHIDLNMIFEAGRTLRIPERVPFRLTPDCVDGLGPEGIGLDGPFKNHAISTLKVLRKEKSLLMMIMDVFKYDPLQKWTGIAKAIENKANTSLISSSFNSSANSSSSSSSDLITKEADRALMRIKEKLEGREEGVVLSEAGHVAFLIQTAMDPELLCQMYFGWQAYF
jgi:hypothetical protein